MKYREAFEDRKDIEAQAGIFVENSLLPNKTIHKLEVEDYYPDEDGENHILTLDIIINGALGQFTLPKTIEYMSGIEIPDDEWREDTDLQETLFNDWTHWRDFVSEKIDETIFELEPELEEIGSFLVDFSYYSGDVCFMFVIRDVEKFEDWRGEEDETLED